MDVPATPTHRPDRAARADLALPAPHADQCVAALGVFCRHRLAGSGRCACSRRSSSSPCFAERLSPTIARSCMSYKGELLSPLRAGLSARISSAASCCRAGRLPQQGYGADRNRRARLDDLAADPLLLRDTPNYDAATTGADAADLGADERAVRGGGRGRQGRARSAVRTEAARRIEKDWLGTDGGAARRARPRASTAPASSILFGFALTFLSRRSSASAAGAVQGYFGGKTDLRLPARDRDLVGPAERSTC